MSFFTDWSDRDLLRLSALLFHILVFLIPAFSLGPAGAALKGPGTICKKNRYFCYFCQAQKVKFLDGEVYKDKKQCLFSNFVPGWPFLHPQAEVRLALKVPPAGNSGELQKSEIGS